MLSNARKFLYLFILIALNTSAISACSSAISAESQLAMSPLDQMPMSVQSAPVAVQEAYQFNAANPEIMKSVPCYCGCGSIGHTSNYDCYVSSVDANGAVIFDNHALGCSICVDITHDVMRILREGKSPQDAQAYVDAAYAKYGPSNMP